MSVYVVLFYGFWSDYIRCDLRDFEGYSVCGTIEDAISVADDYRERTGKVPVIEYGMIV